MHRAVIEILEACLMLDRLVDAWTKDSSNSRQVAENLLTVKRARRHIRKRSIQNRVTFTGDAHQVGENIYTSESSDSDSDESVTKQGSQPLDSSPLNPVDVPSRLLELDDNLERLIKIIRRGAETFSRKEEYQVFGHLAFALDAWVS